MRYAGRRTVKVSEHSLEAIRRAASTRKSSTIARVTAAIASLQRKQMHITLATISQETQALDPARKPIAGSTILRNPVTNALYHERMTGLPRSRIGRAPSGLAKMMRHTKRDLVLTLRDTQNDLFDCEEQLAELSEDNLGLRQQLAQR